MTDDLPPVYGGEILHVHLDDGSVERESLERRDAKRFLGGNGLAAKLVHEHVPADAGALDPENVAVFSVGPMTATPFQSTSRGVVGFVSPMTGGFFDSTFGGTFPQAQKTVGFDAIVLHGSADEPVYVRVDEDGASLEPAEELLGSGTYETCEAVRDREGAGHETHVIAAGPAGENRVRFACLLHDSRIREGVAGRGGGGAVLGSKNVKAVAIREGEFRPEPVETSALQELATEQMGGLMDETEMLQEYGTSGLVNPINEMGKLGRRNMQSEQSDPEDAEAISGELLEAEYVTEDTTCAGCAVACGKHVEVPGEGIEEAKIPEFETIYATAPLQEVYDIEKTIKTNNVCDEMGLDTISYGVTLAFARECYDRDLIPEEMLPENPSLLEFGHEEGVAELARRTGLREGVGDALAEGSFRLAERTTDPEEAKTYLYGNNGLEFAAHSARGLKGMSVGYATSTRGGSHHDTRPTLQYTGEHDETTEGTAEFAARSQHYTALGDSLTQCRFVSEGGWGKRINDRYRDAINLATGWELTTEEVEEIGERVYNLERIINVERGVGGRESDTLPHRVLHEPIPDGPAEGMHCPPEELEAMLDEYYAFRGWDPETGTPTTETVERLGLADVA
jgi:aldehyde:ferredoxin oxidoreductase